MESETTSTNFSCIAPSKYSGLLCAFNGFFFLPIHDFVTIRISHLENIGSLNNADLPNVDIFHYPVSKITYSLISLVFKYWEAVKYTVADTRFPEF